MEAREVLLQAAQAHVRDVTIPTATLRGVQDWEWVLAQAEKHEIVPMLQAALSGADPAVIPAFLRTALSNGARWIAMHTMHQSRELIRIVNHLERENIPVIPFKGPTMGHLAYGNMAFRQALDLDLWVRPDDFERATRRLRELGYVPYHSMSDAERRHFRAWHGADDFVHPEKKIMVEVHHAFFKEIVGAVLDPKGVWRRHDTLAFAGTEVRRLALEDLLLYACAHGMQHRWEKLKWLCDLMGLVYRHPEIRWGQVLRRARRHGSARMVHVAILLLQRLFPVDLPRTVLAEVQSDVTAQALASQAIRRWLFAPVNGDVDPIAAFWFLLRAREHWKDRIPYIMHSLRLAVTPTEKERDLVRLPDSLDWFYYLIRPFRILKDRIKPRDG
jgi:hypothetical protein